MKNIHVYNTIEHTFTGIRSMGQHVYPVTWNICVKLAGKPYNGLLSEEEKESQIQDITVSYQKIKWWMQSYLDDVFVAASDDANAIEFFFGADYDNVFVTTPLDPTDSILCETLCKKIDVLSGDNLHIIEVSLRSTDFESTFFFSDEGGYQIPMDNLVYNGNALFAEPWWCRDDCDTWEAMKAEDVDDDLLRDAVETRTELQTVHKAIQEATFGAAATDDSEIEVVGDTTAEKITSIISMGDLKWNPTKA